MRVLVSAASKHGSTREIAARIAEELRGRGFAVDQVEPEDVAAVDRYEAFVIGSAVYTGHWLSPAVDLVETLAPRLVGRPVWLFSSGPLGSPLQPHDDAVDVRRTVEVTGARDHHLFAGKLDTHALGFMERAMCAALHAPHGDFRDWVDVVRWSTTIADCLGGALAP